jgi:ring-1,2-phenylacetyl-CoA epoxidase subunit PaaC
VSILVLAGIAEKSVKEIAYHAQWSAEWVIRLGDGTQESHEKVQKSIDDLWMWTGELFEVHPVFETAWVRFYRLLNAQRQSG